MAASPTSSGNPPPTDPGSWDEVRSAWGVTWLRTFYSLSAVRQSPERLFVPFAAAWFLVNVTPWGFGPGYLYSFYLTFLFRKTGEILPYTYSAAVVSFVSLLYLFRKRSSLRFVRAFLIAGTVPFAGPGLFEVIYQEIGHFAHPSIFANYAQPYVMFSYCVWVVLGLTGVGWWKITYRFWLLVWTTISGWILWVGLGFPLVIFGTFAQLPIAYTLNIWLKWASFLIFLLPIVEGILDKSSALNASPSNREGPLHESKT